MAEYDWLFGQWSIEINLWSDTRCHTSLICTAKPRATLANYPPHLVYPHYFTYTRQVADSQKKVAKPPLSAEGTRQHVPQKNA